MVSVLVAPLLPGVGAAGLKDAVAPVGSPEAVKMTALVNGLSKDALATLMGNSAAPPGATVCAGLDELTLKSGAGGGVTPVPESAEVCGDPAALSATLIVAVKLAAEAGVNVTEMVQLAPAASELPQVLVCAKLLGLVPATLMRVMVNGALPGLERVAVCAELVVPVVWLGKLRDVGESTA
jgi:hypothetical protein